MSSRELTLIEEFDSLLKSNVISQEAHDRLVSKVKCILDSEESARELLKESEDRCAVLEHDDHIQEQIIVQLNYLLFKDNIK